MKALNVIPFDFNTNTIRAITDEQGEPWFIAKDVFDTLGIAWKRADSLDRINPAWKMKLEIPTRGWAGDSGPLWEHERKNLEISVGPLQNGVPGENHNKKEGRPSKGASRKWKGGRQISTFRRVQELLCLSEPGLSALELA